MFSQSIQTHDFLINFYDFRDFFITINKPRGSPKTGMSMSEIRLIRPHPQNKENPEIRSPFVFITFSYANKRTYKRLPSCSFCRMLSQ